MAVLNCPNCGGSIDGVTPLIRSIDCEYCGSWLRLSNQVWQAQPGQETPLNAPSYLRVGMYGTVFDGSAYTVRGRIRFSYDGGTWDEWWIESSHGDDFWLEEDDGAYYSHQPSQDIELSDRQVKVGQTLPLPDGINLMITEKCLARIIGREGVLPVDLDVSSPVLCVDGVANGREYSIEVQNGAASISQSEEFDFRSIEWEQE